MKIYICLTQLNVLAFFQELLVILFLIIVVKPLAPKIRIMTAAAVTVLCPVEEPGGTRTVMTPT